MTDHRPMTDDIENLLRQMPLKKPPASLDARVLGARPARPGGRWLALGIAGGGLAAAAAVVLAIVLPHGGQDVMPGPVVTAAPAAVAQAQPPAPVRLEHNWSEVSYEGVVTADAQTPLRQFRRRTLDRVQWFDPARNVRMETTIPREEVILISASME